MAAATFANACTELGDRRDLEANFLELLVASERVGDLVDVIKHATKLGRRKQAVRDLARATQSDETFAVEARIAGAVDALTILIKLNPGDEELMDNACKVITACSGTLACSGKVHELHFGTAAVRLREGSLADGVGTRMWAMSRSLSSMLAERPDLVRGLDVLEMGSGTGLCGIVAAKLGAAKVVLTDCEEAVLLNLRECAAANTEPRQAPGQSAQAAAFPLQASAEDLEFDPEDADICNDLDDFLEQATSARCNPALGPDGHAEHLEWDLGHMQVRFMDWRSDLERLHSQSRASQATSTLLIEPERLKSIPGIQEDATFDVVLGSDILYEDFHAAMVAAVLKLRLRPRGVGLLAVAIRDEVFYTDLLKHIKAHHMLADAQDIEVGQAAEGILGRSHDYHGFVALTVEHAA
ncbi:hypothetical protein CVIRNUC_010487 [Coccomyxa viridis]|uniref:Uncharacterized protein n=1 Tax=Coccomyxa viridis TaxID=1274662 RepID=A0AAV1IJF8_9CHLO|nr:hypothetical protein CVIRNUC_010487 [Coccomyxa viridis]